MIKTFLGIAFATSLASLGPSSAQAQEPTQGQEAATDTASPVTSAGVVPTPVAVPLPQRILGDASAPVTIDIYASFICDTCADWHTRVLPAVTAALVDSGEAKVVFHDVITSPWEHSMRAAAIGLCAAPERFFAVAESFMTGLERVMSGENESWYADAIALSGRTEDEMAECTVSETTYRQLEWQQATANTLGFETLPVIRVNGQFVEDTTEAAIREAVRNAPPAPVPAADVAG